MAKKWRQGDIVAPDDAVKLRLVDVERRDTLRIIIVSHTCDIVRSADVEPDVEFLIARIIKVPDGNAKNAHSVRKLHVETSGCLGGEWLELDITHKGLVRKLDLVAHDPWSNYAITDKDRKVLPRWLAQRYSRSAFPDVFVRWLKDSDVEKHLVRLGKRCTSNLVGVYFDLDDDSDHTNPNEPYQLGIYLVHDTETTESEVVAEEAACALRSAFERCCRKTSEWHWIEMLYCESISEDSFSLRAARTFRRWRFEFRSVSGEPIDTADE